MDSFSHWLICLTPAQFRKMKRLASELVKMGLAPTRSEAIETLYKMQTLNRESRKVHRTFGAEVFAQN